MLEQLDELLVDIAPAPVLTGFEGPDHGMVDAARVCRRVPLR